MWLFVVLMPLRKLPASARRGQRFNELAGLAFLHCEATITAVESPSGPHF